MMRSRVITLFSLSSVMLAATAQIGCGDDNDTAASTDAAVVSETQTPEAGAEAGLPDPPHPIGGRNDRAGRAATSSMLIDPSQRNAWNQADTFMPTSGLTAPAAVQQLQGQLTKWDTLDSVDDWHGGGPDGGGVVEVPVDAGPDADGGTMTVPKRHPLVAVFGTDVLIVDTTKPFSPTSYLDVENASLVAGAPGTHTTCGGRWMNDDAIDKQMSFLVKRTLSGVSDGVNAPAKPASNTFPYLAAP